MTHSLTLTQQTILAARVALLTTANNHADDTLRYVAQGWPTVAAQAAQCAFHYASAWYELAVASH